MHLLSRISKKALSPRLDARSVPVTLHSERMHAVLEPIDMGDGRLGIMPQDVTRKSDKVNKACRQFIKALYLYLLQLCRFEQARCMLRRESTEHPTALLMTFDHC